LNRDIIPRAVLAFVVLLSATAVCTAQSWPDPPMPGDPSYPPTPVGPTYPDDPSYPPGSFGPSYPGDPSYPPNPFGPIYPGDPSYPTGGLSSDSSPTTTQPQAETQPATAPSAYSGKTISYLSQGETLTESEVKCLPGSSSLVTDTKGYFSATGYGYGRLRHWIYYNGMWSFGPAAIFYGQQTNTIIYNDISQSIWSYEKYPNGYDKWQYWGYWSPGYHHAWFYGDTRGWHLIAVWGNRSGWSNAIWIYVW
jgi:hypothetical protein